LRTIKLIFALLFCCRAITPSAFSYSEIANPSRAVMLLKQGFLDDGVVEISLELESESGLCGLLATLEYDERVLTFVSCGVDEQTANGLNFSYNNAQGKVTFLLDGKQNSAPSGTLVRFYFKLAEKISPASCDVKLLPIAARCAFFVDDEGALRELTLDTSNARVTFSPNHTEGNLVNVLPRLGSISASREGDATLLYLMGEMTGKGYFAVGFKIFFVDTFGATTEVVIVARVANGEKYELAARLPQARRMCFIITPLSYNGKRIVEGEKQIFLFE
jgi:hypothetical protein